MSSKNRNGDIVKAYKREINLSTQTIKSLKVYSRKTKHKQDNYNT